MKVKFIPSEEFMRQFKRLAKKYPSLVSDYDTFKKELHVHHPSPPHRREGCFVLAIWCQMFHFSNLRDEHPKICFTIIDSHRENLQSARRLFYTK